VKLIELGVVLGGAVLFIIWRGVAMYNIHLKRKNH
jgi:hypothetical protein